MPNPIDGKLVPRHALGNKLDYLATKSNGHQKQWSTSQENGLLRKPKDDYPFIIRMRVGQAVCPPEWDVNLFILRVGGRGVCGDVAVQGLFPGPVSVFLSALDWWVGGLV